jgi:hypothetical protein
MYMPDKESFGGTQRAKEEDFFHRRDRELVERMRSEAEAGAAVRQLAEVAGIADEAVLRELQRDGFSPQTVVLLELAPVVMVAWSGGSVTPQERKEISLLARRHGVAEGVPGYGQLLGWLEARPSEEFFQLTLRAIRAQLEPLPMDERERRTRELVSRCLQIAKVSGGFLRVGSRISAAERQAIRHVVEQLGCTRKIVEEIEEGKLS